MNHLSLVFVIFASNLFGSMQTNELPPNVSTNCKNASNSENLRSSQNKIDLPQMPSLGDFNFELLAQGEILKNSSDRTIRSSFFNSRSSTDIDSEASTINEVSPSKILIKSMNTFTFKLFTYLMNKYDNIIISPISLYSNLIALHAASSGTTEAQLSKLLSLIGVSEKQIALGYRSILDLMESGLGTRNHFKLFNQMLVDRQINVSPAYSEKMAKYYNMEIQPVEFSTESEKIYQFVNSLVNYQTDGNIQTIMDERPDPLSKLVIVNAVHFQGEWSKSFNPKDTSPMAFKNKDAATSRVRMMKMVNEFKAHCDNVRARGPNPPICSIKIPYAGEQIIMQIIQSANARISLKDAVERRMGPQLLQELDAKLSIKLVELGLPSFRLEDTHELREPMDFLGANSMFTKDRANLNKFLDTRSSSSLNSTTTNKKDTNIDLFVNQFRHKASISIDEKGTVASAATSVLLGNRSGNNKFYVDRPFIVLIKDNRSGAILFIGRINNLQSEE